MPAMVGWHLFWGGIVAADAQLEFESPIRKLEEELRLEDMWLCATLLALGLVTLDPLPHGKWMGKQWK